MIMDLQFFSHHKGGGSTANGRNSAGRRLGTKAADGSIVTAGSIIYRQRGTHINPGENVGRGGDDTLYAKVAGVVKFERMGRSKRKVSVYPIAESANRKGNAVNAGFSFLFSLFLGYKGDFRGICGQP